MRYQAFFHNDLRETYLEFIQQDILLSQPLSFHWIQQNVFLSHNTLLKQKVPLKVYLGAVFSSQEPTQILQCVSYNIHKQVFEKQQPKQFLPNLQALEEYLQKLFSKKLHLSLLTDTRPGKGLCFYQSISCLISALYHIEELHWPLTIIQTLSKDLEQQKSLLAKAKEIYQIMTGDYYSKVFQPVGFLEGYAPILCLPSSQSENSPQTNIIGNSEFPFHIALVHSGKNTYASLQELRTLKIQEQLSDDNTCNSLETTNHWFKQATLSMAKCFKKLNEEGEIPEHIDKLFALCDMSTAHIRFLEEIHPQLLELLRKLKYLAAHHPKCKITLLPIGTTKVGGSVIICFTEELFAKTLQEWITKHKTKGYPYTLEYISTMHGNPPKEGICIHTYKPKNIVHTDNLQTIQITEKYTGEEVNTKISKDTYNTKKKNAVLLLDLEEKRIYIQGRRMTAKDIPSQSSTIEILQKLLEQKKSNGYQIQNRDLSPSSYSQSRNEMYSKIITPLKRAIKYYSNYTLALQCQGSNHEFDITLEIPEFPILIKQKQQPFLQKHSEEAKPTCIHCCR